jgi:hypothetical protein
MDFGEALKILKKGREVTRDAWTDQRIAIQTPNVESAMTLPHLCIKTGQLHVLPWAASHADLLAEDWEAVNS